MKLRHLLTLFFLLTVFASFGAKSYTYTSVPNIYKMKNRVWVSNPEKIISAEIEQQLNDTIAAYEARTSNEIVVVALNSTGRVDSKVFAYLLFNEWKIGKKDTNNGLLVLFVEDKREIVFETGSGMMSTLSDDACYQIQQELMIPLFKKEEYSEGLLAGVLGSMTYIDTGLLNGEVVQEAEEVGGENALVELINNKGFLLRMYSIPLLLGMLSVLFAGRDNRRSFDQRKKAIKNTLTTWIYIFMLLCCNILGMVLLLIFSYVYIAFLKHKNEGEKCEKCYSNHLTKLRGQDVRPYLDSAQQKALDDYHATAMGTSCQRCGDIQIVFELEKGFEFCKPCGKYVRIEIEVIQEQATATTDGFMRIYDICPFCHGRNISIDEIYPAFNSQTSSSSSALNSGYGPGLYNYRDDDDDYERDRERERAREREEEYQRDRQRENDRKREREKERERERERQRERDSSSSSGGSSGGGWGGSSRGGGSSSGGGARSGW